MVAVVAEEPKEASPRLILLGHIHICLLVSPFSFNLGFRLYNTVRSSCCFNLNPNVLTKQAPVHVTPDSLLLVARIHPSPILTHHSLSYSLYQLIAVHRAAAC